MVEIKNVQVFGLDRTIKASGNSYAVGEIDTLQPITDRDLKRAKMLGSSKLGHQSHDSFLKGIIVQFDIKYPQYWTPEAQRYHWLEIVQSESKMHRLTVQANSDNFEEQFNKYVDKDMIERVQLYASQYNSCEKLDKYHYFMKTLSNLPMGYELWETVTTNYLQLKTIYTQRKGHMLKEDWGAFCDMIEGLPYMKEYLSLEEPPEEN